MKSLIDKKFNHTEVYINDLSPHEILYV